MYQISRRALLKTILAQPFAAAVADGQVLHRAPKPLSNDAVTHD